MAPAVNHSNLHQIVTETHSEYLTRTLAREDASSLSSKKRTRMETKTVTSTLFENEPSVTLPSLACSTTIASLPCFDWPSTTGGESVPYVHRIVPVALREKRSSSLSPLLHPQSAHAPQAPLTEDQPVRPIAVTITPPVEANMPLQETRRSHYPRPSPPGFLYPSAIVPPSAYSVDYQHNPLQHQNLRHHARAGRIYYPTLLGRMDYELAYLPPGLKVLFIGIFAVITLASVWTVLVWLINLPPGTWSGWAHIRKHRIDKKAKSKDKWMDGDERRPFDKPSKYASKHNTPSTIQCSTNNSSVTSAIRMPFQFSHNNEFPNTTHNGDAIELTHRPQLRIYNHRRERTRDEQQNCKSNKTYIEHRRTSSPPCADLRFSIGPSPTPSPTNTDIAQPSPSSTISSPPNPFLRPPNDSHANVPGNILKPRSSSEWLIERATFFNSNMAPSRPASTPPTLSLYGSSSVSSYDALDTADMEAMEAGTAPLTGGNSGQGSTDNSETSMLRKSLSWLDQGLGMMDGAVDKVVERVVRWTDDDGGDEGLLLPVANGVGA